MTNVLTLNYFGAASSSITIRLPVTSGSNITYVPREYDEEVEQQQRAIQVAHQAILASQDDVTGLLALRPRGKPSTVLYDRWRSQGRVCAESSRYRVTT
jgi:hypothetical protein